MKSSICLVWAALLAFATADLSLGSFPSRVELNKNYTLTWTATQNYVSIQILPMAYLSRKDTGSVLTDVFDCRHTLSGLFTATPVPYGIRSKQYSLALCSIR